MNYAQQVVRHAEKLDRSFTNSDHFLRLAYSMHERTELVSVLVEMKEFDKFSWRKAAARWVRVLNDWWVAPPADAVDRVREFLQFALHSYRRFRKTAVPGQQREVKRQIAREVRKHTRRTTPLLGITAQPATLGAKPVLKVADPPEEALDCLVAPTPKRRLRGLKLLAEIESANLFNSCTMLLDDESKEVVIAALRTMFRCDAGPPKAILPLAASEDKRIRAAAIAAPTKYSCQDAPRWFERGLKDREACVRLETAALLPQLDPNEHRDLFELALYDPNPEVTRIAQKLTARKGYDKG